MTNEELIDSLINVYGEKADCYHCHSNMGCYGTACMEYLCHEAAAALEECMKKENALKLLIDGRSDPVSCNVDAIIKGEYE